jgi:Xaa-Pro aminopeptidase
MKSDLDQIMQANDIDAILVTGPAQHNPGMFYLTGGGHLTGADLIKKRGEQPVIFFNPMERDEAAKTGLNYKLGELLKQAGGDYRQALVQRYRKMLEDMGITSGRLAIYGKMDAGSAYALFSGLQEAMNGLTIVGEVNDSLMLKAMATKDTNEIERIRHMGRITVDVVGQVADFLTTQKVSNGMLVKPGGNPVTVGDVKNKINLWLAERGAENPEGTIFAIGRDAGVPHSTGNPLDPLRLGQTIVFDIFPCEAGGGYYFDFTRTWCLAYAPDEVQQAYENVLDVYNQVMSEMEADALCHDYQVRACELFEAQGHKTIKSDPQTQEGYVHSLGHGLGLHVHERPWFGQNATEEDRLYSGAVVTIEPGLYYPERGFGVRLEDTVWVRPDGELEVLAPFPMDLVLPVKEF